MPTRRADIAEILRQRIVAGLHLGVLRPGTRLPSVRMLAGELNADPRVVLAGYRELALEGLVELRPRSGIFVADTAVTTGEMLPRTAEWVAEVLVEGLSRGVPAIDFPERVRACLQTVRLRAACIECNEDQLTGLCTELSRDYGLHTDPVDIRALASDGHERVRGADLLVTTTYHAAEVQRYAERHGRPWLTVALRPQFLAEAARLLEQGPLYFVAKDPRFTKKLPRIFGNTPGAQNLRALVVGRDDLSAIPSGAPVYVMPAARDHLGDESLLMRVIPAPRIFSRDSARAILHFVMGANLAALAAAEAAAP